MIYSSEHFSISHLKPKDALQLNKLLVSNTDRFIRFLPKTLAENRTLESTRNYIQRKVTSAEKRKEFVFIIHDNHSKDIIGMIILKNLDWDAKQGEFAYCIGNRFKGKGFMSDAIRATSNYVIKNLGLETLQILSHKTNFPSVNTAIKAGFKWQCTLKDEFKPLNGTPLDMELFEFSSSS
ncbi:GNAT family N-acetyltransferase [Gelidibacter maritimus]|uniref:GNAT family N-acetyltransferase n=1 Tax=Gelidibacter maritimus TaxID=2761487 RepID=A0A7W2M346_9FLAO|nr:GNAT family N-acetyltransferase [Gelidibacter maritimus]MBA6151838.1 GNAT family N-acetyltransferase [Gelidibacter maritimus]